MEHLHTVLTWTNDWWASCPTWLSQHVGKADVWAQAWVHFHPGWHGVKLPMIMELIQKFLCGQKNVMRDRNEEKKAETSVFFQTVLIFPYLLTWKPSLFLRWRLLSLRSVFCFSSSSSFSRALMCSSKQMRASSLSISIITGPKKEDYKDTQKIFCACAETCKNTIVEVFHPS